MLSKAKKFFARRKNWQTKQKNGLVSTKRQEKGNMQSSGQETIRSSTMSRLNCSTLKYDKFIKTYVQYQETGEATLVGGKEIWLDILDEYSTLIKSEKADDIFECWKKIEIAETRLRIVDTCTGRLREMYSPAAAEALVEHGFDMVHNLDDEEVYQKQIDFVIMEANSIHVVLKQLEIQYNTLVKEEPIKKRSEIDFDKELAVLARHGYRVKKRKQTVMEFCAAANAFLDEVKSKKNAKRSTI